MTARDAAKLSFVVCCFVLVQGTIMLNIHVAGLHPDVMLLLPIAAGIVGGPARGAVMGFAAGLVADLFVVTPFGLSALVGCLVGYAVGLATTALDRSAWWLPPVAALFGSAAYVVTYAVLGSILGQPQMLHADLGVIVPLVAVVNAVLAIPAVRFVGWALPAASTEGMPGSAPPLGTVR